MQRAVGEQVEALADAAAGRRTDVVHARVELLRVGQPETGRPQRLHAFLGAAASLLVLGRLHGGGAPAHRFACLRAGWTESELLARGHVRRT